MGRDDFPFTGTRVAWGIGTRSNVQLSLLMLELLHLCQRLSSFFKNFFGSLYSSLFDLFGVLLVRGSPYSGDHFQRLLFTATIFPPVS
jgi:hypothetical protein